MLSIKVWYYEENDVNKETPYWAFINHKSPRNYMCSWNFERLLKYIKNELYWQGINENQVSTICICNEKEHWQNDVKRAI